MVVGGRAGSESLSLCRGRDDCGPVVPANLEPLFIALYLAHLLLRGGSYMFPSTIRAGTTPSILPICRGVILVLLTVVVSLFFFDSSEVSTHRSLMYYDPLPCLF